MYNKNISGISCAIIVLTSLIIYCTYIFSKQRNISEAYNLCMPECHIAKPHSATIYLINDTRNSSIFDSINATDLLKISHKHTPDPSHPLYIACYEKSDTAIWAATKQHDIDNIIEFIRDSISNGYTPIKENIGQSEILHFTTTNNRFIHMIVLPGMIGYSYNKDLLISCNNDTLLTHTINTHHQAASDGVILYHSTYKYYSLKRDKNSTTLCSRINTKPLSIIDTTSAVTPSLITPNTISLFQASYKNASFLSPITTLITIRSTTRNSQYEYIITAPITDKIALQAALRGSFTENGYRITSEQLAQWLPTSLLHDKIYWAALRNERLYLSTSHSALWEYVASVRNNIQGNESAVNSIITLYIKEFYPESIKWIPQEISAWLPPFTQNKELILQLNHAPRHDYCLYINIK